MSRKQKEYPAILYTRAVLNQIMVHYVYEIGPEKEMLYIINKMLIKGDEKGVIVYGKNNSYK